MSSIHFNRSTTGNDIIAAHGHNLSGKTIVITGTSQGGLGAHTALTLAKSQPPPATLILLARSASKVQPVIDQISSIAPSIKTKFVPVELSDLESVRQAATQITTFLSPNGSIDILINNAGIMGVPYTLSAQGIESQFATNHISHFLLTALLYPLLKRAPGTKVVNITSDGYKISPFRGAKPEEYNFADGAAYDPWSGYGQSKTANILFTKGLAKRGVSCFAVHPGVIMSTGLSEGMDRALFGEIDAVTRRNTGRGFEVGEPVSIDQGVAGCVRACCDESLPGVENGAYLAGCEVEEVDEYARDPEVVESLWKLSEELVGERFEI